MRNVWPRGDRYLTSCIKRVNIDTSKCNTSTVFFFTIFRLFWHQNKRIQSGFSAINRKQCCLYQMPYMQYNHMVQCCAAVLTKVHELTNSWHSLVWHNLRQFWSKWKQHKIRHAKIAWNCYIWINPQFFFSAEMLYLQLAGIVPLQSTKVFLHFASDCISVSSHNNNFNSQYLLNTAAWASKSDIDRFTFILHTVLKFLWSSLHIPLKIISKWIISTKLNVKRIVEIFHQFKRVDGQTALRVQNG